MSKIEVKSFMEIEDIVYHIGRFEGTMELISHLLVNKQSMGALMPIFRERLLKEWQYLLVFNRIILSLEKPETALNKEILYVYSDEKQRNFNFLSTNILKQLKTASEEEFRKNLSMVLPQENLTPFFNFENFYLEIKDPLQIQKIMFLLGLAPFLEFSIYEVLHDLKLTHVPPKLITMDKNIVYNILRLSIEERLLALCFYLTIKKININTSIAVEREGVRYKERITRHHGETIDRRPEPVTYTYYEHHNPTDNIFAGCSGRAKKKLDLKMVLFLFQQGAIFTNDRWRIIFDHSLNTLKEEKLVSAQTQTANNLIIEFFKLNPILFTKDLENILKLRCKIQDDLVSVEACYLSQQLEMLKSPWYDFWTDKRDLPAINLGLELLEPLKKYSLASDAKKNLAQVKIRLINLAIKPPQTPGKLFIALENLRKSGMITIDEFTVDQKSNSQQSLNK